MALKSSVRTVVEKKLEEYEGRYNHMYLDSMMWLYFPGHTTSSILED
jgi:hypothetical protein